jgi:hypothetical protein
MRATSDHLGTTEYETRVGIEWSGDQPIVIETVDHHGLPYDGNSLPLARYTPVSTTIDASAAEESFFSQLSDLARDCVNQGGISNLQALRKNPDTA